VYEWQAIIKSSGRPQCVRRGVRGNPAALTDVEAEPNGTIRPLLPPSLLSSPSRSSPFFPSFARWTGWRPRKLPVEQIWKRGTARGWIPLGAFVVINRVKG